MKQVNLRLLKISTYLVLLTFAGLLSAFGQIAADTDAARIVGQWLMRTADFEISFNARADGTYSRSIRTGQNVENDKGKYSIKNGVLEVKPQNETEATRLRYEFRSDDELAVLDEAGNGLVLVRQPANAVAPEDAGQPVKPFTGKVAPLPAAGLHPLKTGFPLANPGNGHIIFTRAVLIPVNIPGITSEPLPIPKLFVMNSNGTGQKEFITGEAFTMVQEARWSPNYDRLAFTSNWKEALSVCVQDVFVASAKGGGAVRVTGNELKTLPGAGYGSVTGFIRDNTKSQDYPLEKASTQISIAAQGADGVIYHPGQIEDINIIDKETREKIRDEQMRAFYIPKVAAGKSWVRVWASRNIGHVMFVDIQANKVTDLDFVQLNEGNFAASRPSLTPDGRFAVGMGHILSSDPTAKVDVNPETGQKAELGALGGTESITVWNMADGVPVGALDKLRVQALSAKDPALSPDGQFIACSIGEPSLENLGIIRLADLIAGNPQPQIIARGERIWPSELTLFRTGSFSCSNPVWSPDGSKLVFCRFLFSTEGIQGDLFCVNADGTNLQQLTKVGPNQVATQPCFSPDGKHVAFTVATGKNNPFRIEELFLLQFSADIWRVGIDGTNLKQLTNDGKSSEPAWGP